MSQEGNPFREERMFHKLSIAFVSLALMTGAAVAQEKSADLLGNKGDKVGTIAAKQGPHGVVLRISLFKGSLTTGWHGVHVHEVGDCSDHDKFVQSKGHVNPSGTEHGFLNPKGPHPSDLPNIYAFSDGSAEAETLIAGVSLSGGKVNLIDADGSAVVIHASPDDHLTQPIGGAGARVACAVLK
jgi:Cu-Zn family superoxide dismutase